jgi:hypothetical protein
VNRYPCFSPVVNVAGVTFNGVVGFTVMTAIGVRSLVGQGLLSAIDFSLGRRL